MDEPAPPRDINKEISYYFVAHDVWAQVWPQIPSNSYHHAQFVPGGQGPYTSAGIAGTWLGHAKLKIDRLYLVGHGCPGMITIGKNLTYMTRSDNKQVPEPMDPTFKLEKWNTYEFVDITPLAGWLSSFMTPLATVRVLGCQSAADMVLDLGEGLRGQVLERGDSRGNRGYHFLHTLAAASKRNAMGGIDYQPIYPLGVVGLTRTVSPNGVEGKMQFRNESHEPKGWLGVPPPGTPWQCYPKSEQMPAGCALKYPTL